MQSIALRAIAASALLALIQPSGWAQAPSDTKPGNPRADIDAAVNDAGSGINTERKLGEAQQIKERERYFWTRRGVQLDSAEQIASGKRTQLDFSAQRAEAVEILRKQPPADRAQGSWTAIGPFGIQMFNWAISPVNGRVSAFSQSPSSTSSLLVGGASGGLWSSGNGGASWTAIEGLGTQSIGAIWHEPGNASRVWIGTGERNSSCVGYFGNGLFLSTSGGSNPQPRNGSGSTALNLSYITAISTSPTPTSTVLVGGKNFCNNGSEQSGGIFRSTDSGNSWTKVLQGAVEDIAYLRGNPAIAFAAVGGLGMVKSTDSGQSFNRLPNGLPTVGSSVTNNQGQSIGTIFLLSTVRMAIAAYDPNLIYSTFTYWYTVPANPNQSLTRTDLYRTTNGGTSWSVVRRDVCDGQCAYNHTLDIDPIRQADPLKPRLVLGFIRPWLSNDGGATFNVMTNPWGTSQQVHQDTQVVRFARIASGPLPSPTPLWLGTDGGLWRTDNLGSSYTNLNNGLAMTQFYDIAVHPSQVNGVWGGTQDNSSVARLGANLWSTTVVSGDGGSNAFDTGNPNIVFQFGYANPLPFITRSDQGGSAGSFQTVPTTGMSTTTTDRFPFIPSAVGVSGSVFVGASSLYRASTNVSAGNVSWTRIANNLTQGNSISVITPIRKLATDPLTLYVGDVGGGIWRVFNATGSNTPPTANVTNNFPGGVVSDIAVDSNNPSRIFVTRGAFGGSKLYYSQDQAATWIARGGGLPNVPANSVVVDPNTPANVYVATDIGVYRSFDGGVSFQRFDVGMPLGSVAMDLELQNANRKLYVATYGRGVFVTDL